MKKLTAIQKKLMKIILEHPVENERRDILKEYEISHLFGISVIAQILARKRGVDEEIAAISGAVHDLGRILTGKQENHAQNGYMPVKELLSEMEMFSPEEIERIAKATENHSRKEDISTPEEEVVKDADILHYYLCGLPVMRKSHMDRLENVLDELGLPRENQINH